MTLPAVPALWRAWQNAGAIVPNIKLAISAGAPLPLNLEADIYHQCGLKVHNFYGASECGGIGYDSTETPRTEAGCIGRPLQNVAVSVAEDGCLEVRSRAVAQTYLPKSIRTLANGCYRTSDVAELVDGVIYLRGRAGDLINVAGRKVAPEVIERVLAEHPCVRDCLVFGFPDDKAERGELIIACIALNGPVSADALRKFSLSRLPDWQVPRDWWFVEALPVNERGKLSRADWRRKYGEMKGALR